VTARFTLNGASFGSTTLLLQQIRNAGVLAIKGPPTSQETATFNNTGQPPNIPLFAVGSVAVTPSVAPATFSSTPISADSVASSLLGTDSSSGDSDLLQ
jgi:hypothetical protein